MRYSVRFFLVNGETYWEVRDGHRPVAVFLEEVVARRFADGLEARRKKP